MSQPLRPSTRIDQPAPRTALVRRLALVPCAAALALGAACGGGGGGGGDSGTPVVPTSAPITATNYVGVARQGVGAADYLGDTGGLVTGAQVAPSAQALFAFSRAQALRLGTWIARNPRLATGVVSTTTEACSGGGSITIRTDDVNGNGEADAGDSGTLTANACVEAGATIGGTLVVSFTAVSGVLGVGSYSASASITLQGLSASTAAGSVNGSGQFSLALSGNGTQSSTVELVVSSLTLAGTLGGVSDTVRLTDFRLASSTATVGGRLRTSTTASGSLSSTAVAGGTVTLSTPQALLQFEGDAYATSGQLLAVGANSSRVRLTVLSNSTVQLELDADGNGAYETTSNHTWASLI